VAIKAACRFALLTDGGLSCGTTFIFDGAFSGRRTAGAGGAAALLKTHGVEVFTPSNIEALAKGLQT
jgi:uncharacterized protein YbbK (DUF523 family)